MASASLTVEEVELRLSRLEAIAEAHTALQGEVAALRDVVASITHRPADDAVVTDLRREVEEMKVRLRDSGRSRDFLLVNPKTMEPEFFDDASSWPVWSHKAKAYVGMLDPTLPLHLTAAESREEPFDKSTLAKIDILPSHDSQLQRFLLLRTAGVAHQLVKGAQADNQPAVEIWRRLSSRYDPRGLGSDLIELQELTSPEKLRAKNVEGISNAIQAWEAMERRHADRQGLTLPEKVRTSVLLKLIPAELSREICRQTTKWSSYIQLKEHHHNIQYCRTTGATAMVMSMEPGSGSDEPTSADEILMEGGEILRLEKKDGKTVAYRTGRQANGSPHTGGRGYRWNAFVAGAPGISVPIAHGTRIRTAARRNHRLRRKEQQIVWRMPQLLKSPQELALRRF